MSGSEMKQTKSMSEVEQEAAFNELPVLPNERIWGFWDFTSVNVGLAIATWAFLIGGSTALFVGAKAGIATILIGNVVAVSLVALSTCIPSAKYGLEQYTALRSVFGLNGARLIVLAVVPLLSWGWNAVLAIMFGRATANISNAAFATNIGPNGALVVAFALVAIALSWFVVVKGPVSIEWVNKIVAPGLAVMAVVMLVLIFVSQSWSQLLAAKPIDPFGNKTLDFMIAIELNLAAGFAWWPLMGNLARITKSQRTAFWPNMIGLFAAAVLASIAGLLAALTLGDSDPTVWMTPLGGVALGVLALVFIALANVTSMVGQTYSSCLAMLLLGDITKRLRWSTVAGILLLPAAVAVFFPSAIYDNFFKFLAWQSVGLAPLCGIYFVDFFFLRHRRLDMRSLYEPESRSRYAFWAGLNPAALGALAVGSVVYLLLLNPISFESAGVFRFISASIPAFLAATLTHVLLTKLVVQPLGKGGYEAISRERSSRTLHRNE